MQYDVKTVEDYMNSLDTDLRKEKLIKVRDLIKKYGPQLEEGIEYKMLAFGNQKERLFHLNAQKNFVSLYVGNVEKVENSKELLTLFDVGKGCIRIKKNVKLSESRLEEFIEKALSIWNKGGDLGC